MKILQRARVRILLAEVRKYAETGVVCLPVCGDSTGFGIYSADSADLAGVCDSCCGSWTASAETKAAALLDCPAFGHRNCHGMDVNVQFAAYCAFDGPARHDPDPCGYRLLLCPGNSVWPQTGYGSGTCRKADTHPAVSGWGCPNPAAGRSADGIRKTGITQLFL